MSKKCGKELHPLYQSWYHARRTGILCSEWETDFWNFVSVVGERPENCRVKRKDTTSDLAPSNFHWEEKKLNLKNYKDKAAYMRAYRVSNPEVFKKLELKKHFGITLDEFKEMQDNQDGVCAICGKEETTYDSRHKRVRSLSVDHCHTTGKVRGLLCSHCNHAIGKFNDDVTLLQKAIDYLKTS